MLASTKTNSFLKNCLNSEGKIDYKKLKEDKTLNEKILEIEHVNLDDFNSRKEEFAFWLNTYNLLVLKGVLDKLDKNPNWKGTTNYISRVLFFLIKKYDIGNKKISLYSIENKILRKRFKDPRIHFAINCASSSCPILPNSLFDVENIDKYLDYYTENFINDGYNVIFSRNSNKIILNPIFKWYKDDFEDEGGVIKFIKKYHHNFPKYLKNASISYSKYDWSLNRQ